MSNVTTLIVVGAVMFAVLGGVTLLSHIYSLNSIKSRTVGDGQHGTARWATNGRFGKLTNTFLSHRTSGENKQRAVRSQPHLLYTFVRRFQKRIRQRKFLFRRALWSAVPGTPLP